VSSIAEHHASTPRPGLMPVLALCAALARENERLTALAERERARLERDLHDGAQQRLVSLQIKLALLREQLEPQAPASAATVRRLEGEVEAATAELRALAHGIHPPALTERGLGDALAVAVACSPLPATLHADGVGRCDPQVEHAIYFACSEALQNAVKHARGATRVVVALARAGDALRFEVRDDGAGFRVETTARGAGLANLRERLAAVGGELRIASAPGAGTRVSGSAPLRRAAAAPGGRRRGGRGQPPCG
jgi:signal transduction histidine kinase